MPRGCALGRREGSRDFGGWEWVGWRSGHTVPGDIQPKTSPAYLNIFESLAKEKR